MSMRENPNPKTCGSLCSFVEIDCHINLMHGMHVVFDIVWHLLRAQLSFITLMGFNAYKAFITQYARIWHQSGVNIKRNYTFFQSDWKIPRKWAKLVKGNGREIIICPPQKKKLVSLLSVHFGYPLRYHQNYISLRVLGLPMKIALKLGTGANNQNGNLRWHLPLGVRPPPPLNATNFQTFFYPTF